MQWKMKKMVLLVMFLMISWAKGEEKKDEHKDGGAQLDSEKFVQKVNSSELTGDPAGKQICGNAPNANLCEQTIMAMNNKSEPINPNTVLSFQLEALKEDVGLALKDAEAGKGKDKAIEFCAGSYKKADDEIASAMKKSEGPDLKDVPVLILGAMKHVQSCQTQIEADANANAQKPLQEVNHFLKKVADNAVAVANTINVGGGGGGGAL